MIKYAALLGQMIINGLNDEPLNPDADNFTPSIKILRQKGSDIAFNLHNFYYLFDDGRSLCFDDLCMVHHVSLGWTNNSDKISLRAPLATFMRRKISGRIGRTLF